MKYILALSLLLSVACGKSDRTSSAAASTPASAPTTSAATAAAAAPLAAQPATAQPVAADLPAIIARVNGEAIDRGELEGAVRNIEGRAGGPLPADQRNEILRGLIDQLVAFHLLAQEARARKLVVSEDEVKARIASMRQSFPNEQAFNEALASEGTTLVRLQEDTLKRLQISKLLELEVAPKVSVQEGDVAAFYQQNLDRFKQDESVRASHILLTVPPAADGAQKAQARARADALLTQAQGGADFAQLARTSSQDPGSAPNGGDLGFFSKGQMVPAFETAAFSLKPGAVSPVIETQFGFHIIKLHERRAPRTVPLAEASGEIAQFLTSQRRDEQTRAFVEQLKAKGKVEIYV